MEFRIAKTEFLRGLRLAQGIADRKSTMPMLANVLLRTQGKNQLLVAATDLNVSLTAELKSHNAIEGGITLAVALPRPAESVTTEPRKNAVVRNLERSTSLVPSPPPPPGFRPLSPAGTWGATLTRLLPSRRPSPRAWYSRSSGSGVV